MLSTWPSVLVTYVLEGGGVCGVPPTLPNNSRRSIWSTKVKDRANHADSRGGHLDIDVTKL